ncbi:MAG: major capsid protein [Microviridae sp.]|nr:MAG: major capsid protein [Microviridae sp.]
MSIFTTNAMGNYPSNTFDLSHNVKLTCKDGLLYPICNLDVLPGDKLNISNQILCRLMPMLSPVMHEMDITVTHHFVPLRLLWSTGYERFFAQPIPDDDTPVHPYFSEIVVENGSLSDYLGLPTRIFHSDSGEPLPQYATIDKVSAMFHAAYQKIYNDWYRDQNLILEVPDTLTDGLNSFTHFDVLRRRAWQHDYFTAALPFAQKGEAVEIPIAEFDDVPVKYNSTLGAFAEWETTGGSEFPATITAKVAAANNSLDGNTLFADTSTLSDAASVTINALRWANKLQEFLERNARGGTRYIELVRSHFGVISSDARQQRAEFLGWSRTPIVISEVLTQANTEAGGEPVGVTGEMYGHGIGVGRTKNAFYRAEEHGIFMSLLSIRPKTNYSQGIPRKFSRFQAVDYPWPEFAHLGEQEVKNREIFYGYDALNDETFGYMQRYAEAKYENDRYAGDMRTSLNYWHMGRIFEGRPSLNQTFIECRPTRRIFNVTAEVNDQFVLHIKNQIQARRILPKFGIPSL